jgi:hypothetical protein
MPVYNKVTDDEGNVTYEEVEIATLVTDELVKETEAYKNIFTESVSRRQRITDLNKQLKTLADSATDEGEDTNTEGDDANTSTTDSSEDVPPLTANDIPALLQELVELQAKQASDAQQAVADHNAIVQEVAIEFNVPTDVLRGSTKAELQAHAQVMVDAKLVFPSVGANGTNPDNQGSDLDTIMGNIYGELGIEDTK